jgi:Bacterial extracellular solute-binding proteins, family 3
MRFLMALPLLAVLISPCQARTLDDVRASGVLACGVVDKRPGFALRDKDYQWSGFDVDICRAIAAAVVGDPGKVNFMGLQENELAVALQSGEVDVLPRGAALSLASDTQQGLMFVTPSFFDEGQDGRVAIYGPVVRQGDSNWQQVVRWVVWSMLEAEALGVDGLKTSAGNRQASSAQSRFLQAGQAVSSLSLGLEPSWPTKVVAGVGNYGEVFERNFGSKSPVERKRGLNNLSRNGGLFVSPSFE